MLPAIRAAAVAALLAWAGVAVIGSASLLGLILPCGYAECVTPADFYIGLLLLVSLLAAAIAVVLATLAALRAHRWVWAALLPPLAIGSVVAAGWFVTSGSNVLAYEMRTRYGWDDVSWYRTAGVLFMALIALPPLLALTSTLRVPRRIARGAAV